MILTQSPPPVVPSATLKTARLRACGRFYARLLGLELVVALGVPVQTVFLARPVAPAAAPGDPAPVRPFVLRVTTAAVNDSARGLTIRVRTIDDLILAALRADAMGSHHAEWWRTETMCGVTFADPDGRFVEFQAPRVSEGDPGLEESDSEMGAVLSPTLVPFDVRHKPVACLAPVARADLRPWRSGRTGAPAPRLLRHARSH